MKSRKAVKRKLADLYRWRKRENRGYVWQILNDSIRLLEWVLEEKGAKGS